MGANALFVIYYKVLTMLGQGKYRILFAGQKDATIRQ